jgi:hypothetical protein
MLTRPQEILVIFPGSQNLNKLINNNYNEISDIDKLIITPLN